MTVPPNRQSNVFVLDLLFQFVYAHVYGCLRMPEEGVSSPGTGVTVSHGLFYISVEAQAL